MADSQIKDDAGPAHKFAGIVLHNFVRSQPADRVDVGLDLDRGVPDGKVMGKSLAGRHQKFVPRMSSGHDQMAG